MDKALHDAAAEILPQNIRLISKSSLFYDITIVDKYTKVLYNKQHQPDADPGAVLEEVINRAKPETYYDYKGEENEAAVRETVLQYGFLSEEHMSILFRV